MLQLVRCERGEERKSGQFTRGDHDRNCGTFRQPQSIPFLQRSASSSTFRSLPCHRTNAHALSSTAVLLSRRSRSTQQAYHPQCALYTTRYISSTARLLSKSSEVVRRIGQNPEEDRGGVEAT